MNERELKILADRARRLALPPQVVEDESSLMKIVSFSLGTERYAIEASYVREICLLKEYTSLPSTPIYVFGVMNLRGEIIPIVDLRRILDLPIENPRLNFQIILRDKDQQLAILAETIIGLRSIKSKDLTHSLATLTGVRREFLNGITFDQISLLNVDRILKTNLLTA